MNTKNANQTLIAVADEFTNSDRIPEYMAEALIRCPEVPCSNWSLGNQILMQIGGPTADARGYRQWQAAGRHVKKGSKARYILTPIIKRRKDKDDDEKIITVGFKTVPVFAVQDTDGAPVPKFEPKVIPPLAQLAKITYRNSTGGEAGAYYPTTDEIVLCSEDPSVFFHELTHLYDNKSHEKTGTGQEPIREMVAELGATVLCRMYDVKTRDSNHMAYIAHYAGAKTPAEVGAACMKVAERVMKAIQLILADAAKLA